MFTCEMYILKFGYTVQRLEQFMLVQLILNVKRVIMSVICDNFYMYNYIKVDT